MRLADGRDQAGLARDAAVSLGALRHLERGEGSTLRTVIRVARALGREDWLDALAPAVTVSPLDLMRERRTPRQRVYRERGGSA
ncbi:XRE family transcriptional regulator [Galbitalea soli]|uniref:XRE family transcriptional regulator n=2 Tax=Galbitalea soli TaxID=1268042 RepID=A0A7C9TNJ5_9MICO|nr:XRE family transcriptional regulator [Galbitalea soli]